MASLLLRAFCRCLPAMVLGLWLTAGGVGVAADRPPKPSPPVDFDRLPWIDGEALTYHVSWMGFDAANGTFTAQKKSGHWEFHLALASIGWVDSFYPFTSSFWCVLAPGLWRSVTYGESRFEPKRTIKEQTTIDYDGHQAHRANWMNGETKDFPIAEAAVDDVGTMLYHVRTGAWKPGDYRTVYVYESNSEKQGEVECRGKETGAVGVWPAQPLLHLYALPTVGTHRRGHLDIWMTDDARRLPLKAEIAFKYGTFTIDLLKAEHTVTGK